MSKGFTLAELMGVIVILAILGVVVTTAVDRNITNSRYETCLTQEKNIIEAVKMYVTDNPSNLPTAAATKVYINNLISGGYLDEEMENPMTGKTYQSSGNNIYVEISIKSQGASSSKNYVYDVKYNNSDEACHK